MAKDAASRYDTGKRSPAWVKIKVLREQEFVVGGWTTPRQTRAHFGSLVIGYYEPAGTSTVLRPAGCVGSGFSSADLERLHDALRARVVDAARSTRCRRRWNRRVGCDRNSSCRCGSRSGHATTCCATRSSSGCETTSIRARCVANRTPPAGRSSGPGSGSTRTARPREGALDAAPRKTRGRSAASAGRGGAAPAWPELPRDHSDVVAHLERLEASRRDGTLVLPGGARLDVSNLHKVFWPAHRITKGALLRHYVHVAAALLPVLADRPLIMKRYPNGVTGKSFYQQRAPDDPPASVRVETVRATRTCRLA